MPFTYQYSQPSEYQFSLDSIEAPLMVSELLKSQFESIQLKQFVSLDLCSGCGVMGFELNYHLAALGKWDFIEVQNVYLKYFQENLAKVKTREEGLGLNPGEYNFINMNYGELRQDPSFKHRYDLVICNPPYFVEEQGLASESEFKRRCRFFVDSDLPQLVSALQFCLKPTGQCYILVMDSKMNGFDPESELKRLCLGRLKIEKISNVRRATLLKIYP